jgi:hypothetical protein
MRKGKDLDPELDPHLWLTDPDLGGPKTCGSCGSGSPTLPNTQRIFDRRGNRKTLMLLRKVRTKWMLKLIFKEWHLMSVELRKYSVAAGCLCRKLLVFFTAVLVTVSVLPPGFSSHKNLGTCTHTVRFLLSLVEYNSNHKTSDTKEGGAHESSKQASQTGIT